MRTSAECSNITFLANSVAEIQNSETDKKHINNPSETLSCQGNREHFQNKLIWVNVVPFSFISEMETVDSFCAMDTNTKLFWTSPDFSAEMDTRCVAKGSHCHGGVLNT